MKENDFDLLIIGSGLVGASLAIALSGQGMRIAVVEAGGKKEKAPPSYDDRAIALAYGSSLIFQGMGIWSLLSPMAEAIKSIHVSDRGQFGFSHLSAEKEKVPVLGYVIRARDLGMTLLHHLSQCEGVTHISPARVVSISNAESQVRLGIEREGVTQDVTANLVVAADGGHSFVRDALDIPTREWGYDQHAVVANITPDLAHEGRAFERFTEAGPVALLPMHDNHCALVWTVENDRLESVMAMDDQEFLSNFQQRFGYRLGRFKRVGKRMSYPLALIRAKESVRPGVALIGNAAHTLHPIAGQGFNLGIRDVASLAEVLVSAKHKGKTLGEMSLLNEYEAWRKNDLRNTSLFTDSLVRLFGNPLMPVRFARNLGMLAIDGLPFTRHQLARAAMGQLGRLPRLSQGLPLVDKAHV